jgi:hypothetical protein
MRLTPPPAEGSLVDLRLQKLAAERVRVRFRDSLASVLHLFLSPPAAITTLVAMAAFPVAEVLSASLFFLFLLTFELAAYEVGALHAFGLHAAIR